MSNVLHKGFVRAIKAEYPICRFSNVYSSSWLVLSHESNNPELDFLSHSCAAVDISDARQS
jgi:hypothetical protein